MVIAYSMAMLEWWNSILTQLFTLYPLDRILLRLPPHKDWKFQRQTTPPTWGWAHRTSHSELEKIVSQRRPYCLDAIQKWKESHPQIKPHSVTLTILSCKRWDTLSRLIQGLKPYFEKIETGFSIEKVLLDNGSGPDLIAKANATGFFDRIVAHPENLGMVGALGPAFEEAQSEVILFLEDDFVIDTDRPFLDSCFHVLNEYPEIGIIRLKNQNNWWKPGRKISPLRKTQKGVSFWTWLPSPDKKLNVWSAGSVLFRKASFDATGPLPKVHENPTRNTPSHQGYLYECVYGEKFNSHWLAAKLKDHQPFFQPNDNEVSPGWGG